MTGQQLKNSILQMAVQGKLVPQDPNDEPTSVLLERIRKEKEQLIKEGKIKKEKNPSYIFRGADNLPYEKVGKNEPVCIADEVPFEIPESWEWVRLKNLVKKEIKRGKSPKYAVSSNIQVFAQKCNVKAGGIDMTLAKYLDDTVFPKYPEQECMRDSDIVINSTGNGTLGRIGMFHDSDRINENIIVPDSHVTVIRASEFLSADYIFYVLNYYQPYLEKSCSGSTNQTELKPAVISELFIPVPPVNEQTRIITKLIEALNLSKLYGEKEILLQKYNQDFPEQLKKSILQYAIQGKLVPQNPSAINFCFSARIRSRRTAAGSSVGSCGTSFPCTASCKIDFLRRSGKLIFRLDSLISEVLYCSKIGISDWNLFTIRCCSCIGGKGKYIAFNAD